MRRFFSTSSVALKVPAGAPARVQQVPIPRTVRTTAEINEYVAPKKGSKPRRPHPSVLAAMFPEPAPELTLKNPDGVWYFVERSRSGNLPVYTDYNNAGHVWTEVRKISGNVGALRNDIKKQLNLGKEDIWVKNTAQAIVIKGDVSGRVKKMLAEAF